MTAALSEDLRLRVIGAIEDGMSTRAAARHFGVGESTSGRWHRQWRAMGHVRPAKQGNPGWSRLDAHAGFILGLIDEGGKDITLAEMADRLASERHETVDPTTIHNWLKKRGITFKKRQRTRQSRTAKMSV